MEKLQNVPNHQPAQQWLGKSEQWRHALCTCTSNLGIPSMAQMLRVYDIYCTKLGHLAGVDVAKYSSTMVLIRVVVVMMYFVSSLMYRESGFHRVSLVFVVSSCEMNIELAAAQLRTPIDWCFGRTHRCLLTHLLHGAISMADEFGCPADSNCTIWKIGKPEVLFSQCAQYKHLISFSLTSDKFL